ncbi:COX7A, subunit VIIa of cytochrome c oxidase [Serpula lacrymans var. lacrymans S7.3]|uniref:Cytochrome c oxidase subunit 9, mitochondrial n=2 Tax=Serpula lacrymans var. lacrymans TaxID=341189 RepID=F8Q3V5_SERL3|nr:subunit VIIa of cytochrome c oxidase,COX9 [Serpula lacrymans var. lacrymans S7.9]EGN96811.1 COX7A, subunit VIIa of cytochrome c oxidase [Serpula lacrymans var. lacrymans S7.3]EGO22410.1 subunit VIIa of cytochrome c oxidase,COX9 [Serpula lacrymans var. lacrymans S7.9]
MSIAPITGKIRKRLWLDLSVGLGLGVSSAYAFWYGIHLKSVQRQEEFYLRLERARRLGQA